MWRRASSKKNVQQQQPAVSARQETHHKQGFEDSVSNLEKFLRDSESPFNIYEHVDSLAKAAAQRGNEELGMTILTKAVDRVSEIAKTAESKSNHYVVSKARFWLWALFKDLGEHEKAEEQKKLHVAAEAEADRKRDEEYRGVVAKSQQAVGTKGAT
jgi:hypothetical protein